MTASNSNILKKAKVAIAKTLLKIGNITEIHDIIKV